MNHLENFKRSLEKTTAHREKLIEKFLCIRNKSVEICEVLETEDYVVQPCQEVSPPKWHLAHTTWFFEELILVQFSMQFKRYNEGFRVLFNSYYKSAGQHWLQGNRGHLSRPTVKEILSYREIINSQIVDFLRFSVPNPEVDFLMEVGLHHEQQHQELLYMDIKFILGANPTHPKLSDDPYTPALFAKTSWKDIKEEVYEVGHDGQEFAFDNEGPRHKTYIYPCSIRENLVSNGEYLKFMEDKGYSSPKLWLSEGWDWINTHSVTHPLYWKNIDGIWYEFTLHGLVPLDLNSPVTHISYFEADAFANWTDHRLPTEFELEIFLRDSKTHKRDSNQLHPNDTLATDYQVWNWSKSHYSPYPGYKTFKGMLGEYNGKFMCNQFVLKGGCVATPRGHYRHSYRNFYQPHQRWMFSGIRIARDS